MEEFSLNGFQMCHIEDDMRGVLKERRVILGLTQQQVADRAGIRIQQYQKFESGERDITRSTFNTACRVIEALEMDIPKFYHGDYTIGEKVFQKDGELYYKKTGRSVNADVE